MRDNDALRANPAAGDERLSDGGSDWLWAVFAIFLVTFLVFFVLTWMARAGEKVFHYLFAITLLTGSIAYFAMASDLAWDVVTQVNDVSFNSATRQIFFAKYVYWVVSFPAATIALGLLSGVSWATIIYNVTLAWIWVLSYLFSAYTASNYKWGFFALGTMAYFALAFSTLAQGHSGATRLGYTRDHSGLAGWTNFLWFLYPIAFGVSDGGNVIGVTQGFIFFGILDLLMIPVLAIAFIFLARRWDYNRLNLAFTQYGRVPATNSVFPEKHAAAPRSTAGTGTVTGEPVATNTAAV